VNIFGKSFSGIRPPASKKATVKFKSLSTKFAESIVFRMKASKSLVVCSPKKSVLF
jgi:hypothetical protein